MSSESIVDDISLDPSISSTVRSVVGRVEEEDPNEEFAKTVWIGVCLARPDGMDFCEDQDRVVSATSVSFEGTSGSGVRQSEGEMTGKIALGEVGWSSSYVITSLVGSSFSRTMSIYLRLPKNLGVPRFYEV